MDQKLDKPKTRNGKNTALIKEEKGKGGGSATSSGRRPAGLNFPMGL